MTLPPGSLATIPLHQRDIRRWGDLTPYHSVHSLFHVVLSTPRSDTQKLVTMRASLLLPRAKRTPSAVEAASPITPIRAHHNAQQCPSQCPTVPITTPSAVEAALPISMVSSGRSTCPRAARTTRRSRGPCPCRSRAAPPSSLCCRPPRTRSVHQLVDPFRYARRSAPCARAPRAAALSGQSSVFSPRHFQI